jgi:hypothetical protein
MGFAVSQPNQSSGPLNTLVTQTDQLEPGLATLQSLASAEGADVALIRTATVALLAVLTAFEAGTNVSLLAIQTNLNDQFILLTQMYGAVSTIDSNVAAIASQSAPLVYQGVDVWEPGSNGDYAAMADPTRRAVWVNNNTGEATGRSAGTLFIDYQGSIPDRVRHAQLCPPGQGVWLHCPSEEFRIFAEGISGVNGSYTIARYA